MTKFEGLDYAGAVLLPVLGAAIWNWTPTRKQTRGNTFFAASVAPGFRESSEGVAILREFRLRLWTWTLLVAAVCVIGIARLPPGLHGDMVATNFVSGAAVMGMLGASLAFVLGHRRTRREATAPMETTVRMASLAVEDDAPSGWVGFVDWLAMLGPPAIPVATLVFLALHWQQHSPVFSRADSVFTALYGLGLGLCFGTANQWALRFRARSSDWAHTAAASHKYRTYLGAMLAFTFGYLTWQLCATVVMSYKDSAQWLRPFQIPYRVQIPLAILFPLCIGGMALWLRKHLATESGDPMADKYWKWGYFYFNPGDPALVVPTRSGAGFSHNYARRSVWWVGGVVVVMTIASFVHISYMTRAEDRESQRTQREMMQRPDCEGCIRVEH